MEKAAEEKAAVSYATSAKSRKEKLNFYVSKGDEYLLRGEYGNAIAYYNEAQNIRKKNPDVLLRLGEAYRLADMQDEAVDSYNKALKYGSKDIRVYLGLGDVYNAKFLYEKSEEFYRKAAELGKNNIAALTGLADIFSEEGKYAQAIEFYKEVLSVNPADEVKLKLAMLSYLTGNEKEVPQYNTVSGYSAILNGYLEIKNNPDSAVSYFTSSDEYFLGALAYLKKNNVPAAKKSLGVVLGGKEDSLSKRLAAALVPYVK